MRVPDEANNYIFTNFTESHFQHHLFAAKREAINHPFLIKIRERDYKQAVVLFRLVIIYLDISSSHKFVGTCIILFTYTVYQ